MRNSAVIGLLTVGIFFSLATDVISNYATGSKTIENLLISEELPFKFNFHATFPNECVIDTNADLIMTVSGINEADSSGELSFVNYVENYQSNEIEPKTIGAIILDGPITEEPVKIDKEIRSSSSIATNANTRMDIIMTGQAIFSGNISFKILQPVSNDCESETMQVSIEEIE